MGLLTKILIASAIKGAVAITENVAEVAVAKSNERAAEANARAAANSAKAREAEANARAAYNRAQAQSAPRTSIQSKNNQYDIDLFYAKVAIISYIAKVDNAISKEERSEFEQMINVAGNMFGYKVAARARDIIDHEGGSFIALEPYLQKVQDKDLDSFLFYADEFARTDRTITPEEDAALKKIRSYIDSRKGKKEFHDLICAGCGGQMRSDAYGYKAVCICCGRETILNTENSPLKANQPVSCASCGSSLAHFDNSKRFAFCPYCGGDVYKAGGQRQATPAYKMPDNQRNNRRNNNEPNLFISYTTINPSIGMVTRIVSTGVKNSYSNGQTQSFHLPQGHQTIILKIGLKNYSRDIVIPASNSPVRIYASFNGRAQISIDQPAY